MGVFDSIQCFLPLPDWGGDPDHVFQTKDTPTQFMGFYMIGRDGKLYERRGDWETVPPEERPFPPGHKFHEMIGVIREVNKKTYEVEDVHRDIFFYDSIAGEWFEYRARFTDGTCSSITRVRREAGPFVGGRNERDEEGQAKERPGEDEGQGS